MLTIIDKRKLLLNEAARWVGTKEGEKNSGQIVTMFQKHVGIGNGDPWCAAFVHYCISQVDMIGQSLDQKDISSGHHKSASCVMTFNKSQERYKGQTPQEGSLIVWRKKNTMLGHIGIVSRVYNTGSVETIEGNTSPMHNINREGDGVYIKQRSINNEPNFVLMGFIYPWGF